MALRANKAASPAKSPAAKTRKPVTQQAVDEFIERVRHFRAQARKTASQLASVMEAELARLAEEAQVIQPAARRRKFCQEATRRIAEVKIKPSKGRLRDLRRIDDLLRELRAEIDPLK